MSKDAKKSKSQPNPRIKRNIFDITVTAVDFIYITYNYINKLLVYLGYI